MTQLSKPILYFCDPVGVTEGYQNLFQRLTRNQAHPVSLYRVFQKERILHYRGNRKSPGYSIEEGVLNDIRKAMQGLVDRYEPRLIVTSDPATLFLCVDDYQLAWNWMTIENARGGVYKAFNLPLLVTYPLTAWYSEIRERDIASANQGFGNEEDFERAHASNHYNTQTPPEMANNIPSGSEVTNPNEGDSGEPEAENPAVTSEDIESNAGEDAVFFHPIKTKVQVGKFCLESDWRKARRLLAGMEGLEGLPASTGDRGAVDKITFESNPIGGPQHSSIDDIHKRLLARNRK